MKENDFMDKSEIQNLTNLLEYHKSLLDNAFKAGQWNLLKEECDVVAHLSFLLNYLANK